MNKDRLKKLLEDKRNEDDNSAVEFIESLQKSLEKWGTLTEKQQAAFDRLEYLSSPEGIKYAEEWKREYQKNLRPTATICAHYYLANPPYFRDIAMQVLKDGEFVPTERQYRAMCENKYTTRVVKEVNRKPDFNNGDIVQVRDTASMPYHLFPIKGKPSVVINNSCSKITTHARGAKVYKILPFGQSKVFDCQERYLKGFRPQKAS